MSLSLAGSSSSASSSRGPNGPSQAVLSLRDRGVYIPNLNQLKVKELRSGHRQSVRGLGWSIDGRKLASCGADRIVRVWVPERSIDHRASTELRGHTESVDQLVWHPTNPDVLATASADKTVRIWDTRAKSQQAASGSGTAIPTGPAATSNSNGSSTGASAAQVIQTPGANINVSYHPEGNLIAVGDKADTVSIIDTRQNRIVHTVCTRKPTAPPSLLASQDSSTGTGKPATVVGSLDEINELCWSANGELLFLSSGSGSIFIHSGRDFSRLHTVIGHTANVFCLQWDPYSRYLASASSDAMIALWDTHEWYSHKMIRQLTFPARSISFSHDGELLAAGGEDPFIAISATSPSSDSTDDLVHKIQLPPSTMINTLAWHPSKYVLAYAGDEAAKDIGTVRVFGL
ncbi:WD40 repeat-like protein [Testicularia cyperi]|uniref:WD40 repeat-like protein n=1 Tax=Testicularia cyperi TaxID=1882483 RepID=A0A317XYP4_9BASI|nr:WD40 repeat-like protein [Testicularia cyperi]